MQAVRQKIKRALSMHDKETNFDEHEELDEETTGHLHKQLEEAEAEDSKYPQGRPGSFLNRLISHGNKKTEDQIAAEIAAGPKASDTTTASKHS
ncbi:unnamed protein product [Aureobasidium pullulans]|uniref:Uncharacterized protein n=2 Tax=Aureobasidium pullulans TaxID=5580 RepID=A0A074XR91_AURPU|nr:uncharacterized protein M438DRAFT_335299 [Aureobasidium pullulans EXF-150]KAG2166029.1 hypothetical protein JADG_005768 [Aureobasidium pullulans]KEQ84522.1 hypothetical protein M438DRAFT_335299 [Aureobasidium pullulans EXF-150]THV75417.1 hypothetical protein D6D28_01865 [Aureobasidium pullulans]THV87200.1 hypothetical protein D6D29_00931 [Aureobasidium pullulans]THW07576.1 hypothetical protein D6D26_00871 [Aureobasidium pullulans]